MAVAVPRPLLPQLLPRQRQPRAPPPLLLLPPPRLLLLLLLLAVLLLLGTCRCSSESSSVVRE